MSLHVQRTGSVSGVLVARDGLSPIMVGRSGELARLGGLLAGEPGPHVALVEGEAGVGKTRLIREFLATAADQCVLLAAQAEQGAMGRPWQLLLEALDREVSGWTRVPEGLRRWEDPLGVLLRPVAPQLGAIDREYTADELGRAATELVRALAGDRRVVLVFEDLHWADAESLTLFHRLAVAADLPATLVGSYRPEDLDRRHVAELLAAVERARHVEHIVLGRLDVGEVVALASAVRQAAVPYAVAADLHRRTGGNPFFLEELLVAAGNAPVDRLAHLPLPITLTEAVIRHLDGLDPEARQVVDAAAVLGQRVPFDLLASVTGLGEDGLVEVLRSLVGQGLVVEDDPDVFSFRHALTREAIAGRLLGRERRRLHEKALTALQEVGSDDWAALAYHAEGAGRLDEMVEVARCGAAAYLRAGATYQALRLAEVGLAEAEPDTELLELGTRAAWSLGLMDSAIERAERWRQLAREAGDPVETTNALRVLARLRWETGNQAAHVAAVEEAQAVAGELPPGEARGWVANLQAESCMLRGLTEDAGRWADEALEMAGVDASPALQAAVLVNKGSAWSELPDRRAEGETLLVAGLDAAAAAGDYLTALRAANNLAHLVMPRWPPERSAQLLARMGALVEESGRHDWLSSWHGLRAVWAAHVVGDLASARREAVVAEQGFESRWVQGLAAELALEAGDPGPAVALAASLCPPEDPDEPSRWDDEAVETAWPLAVRAAALMGDQSGTEAALSRLAEVLARPPAKARSTIPDGWYHAAFAAVRAGIDPATVRLLHAGVTAAIAASAHMGDPGWPIQLEAALDEAEAAPADQVANGYRQAAAPPGYWRSRPAAGEAHLGAARALLAAGRLADARVEADRADRILHHWSGPRRAELDALLRRLGGPGHGSSSTSGAGAGELTEREREVVALIAEGLSNGEIGERLFISTKTASVHVSNILRKLAMTSRSEVAAWAVRAGLSR